MKLFNKLKIPEIIFILSILTAVFWCLAQFVNVYYFAVVGVIFEIAWLPMIALLFCLPIVSFIFLVKEKFNLKSLYLYSFIIALVTVLFMILRN